MPTEPGRKRHDTRSGSSVDTVEGNCSHQQEIYEIKKMLENITNKLQVLDSLTTTVQNLEKTVTFISSQYDTIYQASEDNKTKVQNLNIELNKLNEANIKNVASIKLLTDQVNSLEQYSRNNNIEIHGLEESPNEDCKEKVLYLANKLNIPITKTDIDVAHRIKSSNNRSPKIIIAQFSSRTKRDLFMQKRRYCLIDNHLPGTTTGTTIYFNENMSPFYKNLYRLTRIQAKAQNFQYVWFKNSKLFIRRNAESPTIRINSEEDIFKHMGFQNAST